MVKPFLVVNSEYGTFRRQTSRAYNRLQPNRATVLLAGANESTIAFGTRSLRH